MCKIGGFYVVQWMSVSRMFLQSVDPAELSIPHFDFHFNPLPVDQMLGTPLNWELDRFVLSITMKKACTMRQILAGFSSIHDPSIGSDYVNSQNS